MFISIRKLITMTGEWRFAEDGQERLDNILNKKGFIHSILVPASTEINNSILDKHKMHKFGEWTAVRYPLAYFGSRTHTKLYFKDDNDVIMAKLIFQ